MIPLFHIFLFWMTLFNPVSAHAVVSQVHLSWQNDPATTMTLIWTTEKNHTPPQVQYGTTTSYGSVAKGGDTSHGVILHTVELTGLQPDTLYHYRVSDDRLQWSPDMTFRTAPPPGQTGEGGFVVTVSGDKGPHADAQAINKQITLRNADLHVIVGDLAYSSNDTAFHAWIDQQQEYAKSAPIMPAWGNHDTTKNDPPYSYSQAHFALPTHATPDERFYSYDVGNTHFIVVDSNSDNRTDAESPQYQWLKKDLSEASGRSSIQWIVVYFHHNIYSAGGKYSNTATPVRAHFQPLFDQYGVDLVFHGHMHYYARSFPVAYNEVIKNTDRARYDSSGKDHGQIYITTGGGGKPLYSCPKQLPPFIVRCDEVYSFGVLTIHPKHLSFQAFKSDGTLLDEGLTLTKSAIKTEVPIKSGKNHEFPSRRTRIGEAQWIPSEDAMVHESYPEKNYGDSLWLEVDRNEGGGQKEVYLKFNVTDIDGPIREAKLQLKTANIPFSGSDSGGLLYTVSDSAWTENTLTWTTRPSRDPFPLPHHKETAVGQDETITFDLSSVMTTAGVYSFAIVSTSSNGVIYNAKESADGEPTLLLRMGD